MVLIYKNEFHRDFNFFKFLLSYTKFLKFFLASVVIFTAVGIAGIFLNNRALMLSGYAVALILVSGNLMQLPVYLKYALSKKTWLLCGNAYKKFIWTAIFIGVLYSLFCAPAVFFGAFEIIEKLLLVVFIFTIYTLIINFLLMFSGTMFYNAAFFIGIFVSISADGWGIHLYAIIGPGVLLFIAFLINFLAWGLLFKVCKNNTQEKFRPQPKNSNVETMLGISITDNFSLLRHYKVLKNARLNGKNAVHLLVAGKIKGLITMLKSIVIRLIFVITVAMISSIMLDGNLSFKTLLEYNFIAKGYILPLIMVWVVTRQLAMLACARCLWLVVGGNRNKLYKLIMKACRYNTYIDLVIPAFLLVMIVFFSGTIQVNLCLLFIIAVLLAFLVGYINMLLFCLGDWGPVWVVLACFGATGMFAFLAIALNQTVFLCISMVFLASVLWIIRRRAMHLWQYVDFQEHRA